MSRVFDATGASQWSSLEIQGREPKSGRRGVIETALQMLHELRELMDKPPFLADPRRSFLRGGMCL